MTNPRVSASTARDSRAQPATGLARASTRRPARSALEPQLNAATEATHDEPPRTGGQGFGVLDQHRGPVPPHRLSHLLVPDMRLHYLRSVARDEI